VRGPLGRRRRPGPGAHLTPAVRRTLRNRARHEVDQQLLRRRLVRTWSATRSAPARGCRCSPDDEALNEGSRTCGGLWAARPTGRSPAASCAACGTSPASASASSATPSGSTGSAARHARLRLIEPDQVTDGFGGHVLLDRTATTGSSATGTARSAAYRSSSTTPATTGRTCGRATSGLDADTVPPANVLHWFSPSGPASSAGDAAGPGPADLRPTPAVHKGDADRGRVAAMLAGVLELHLPVDDDPGEPPTYETFDTVELVRGMLLTLPGGGKPSSSSRSSRRPTTRCSSAPSSASAARASTCPSARWPATTPLQLLVRPHGRRAVLARPGHRAAGARGQGVRPVLYRSATSRFASPPSRPTTASGGSSSTAGTTTPGRHPTR
jgi:hypothetical protein